MFTIVLPSDYNIIKGLKQVLWLMVDFLIVIMVQLLWVRRGEVYDKTK